MIATVGQYSPLEGALTVEGVQVPHPQAHNGGTPDPGHHHQTPNPANVKFATVNLKTNLLYYAFKSKS